MIFCTKIIFSLVFSLLSIPILDMGINGSYFLAICRVCFKVGRWVKDGRWVMVFVLVSLFVLKTNLLSSRLYLANIMFVFLSKKGNVLYRFFELKHKSSRPEHWVFNLALTICELLAYIFNCSRTKIEAINVNVFFLSKIFLWQFLRFCKAFFYSWVNFLRLTLDFSWN